MSVLLFGSIKLPVSRVIFCQVSEFRITMNSTSGPGGLKLTPARRARDDNDCQGSDCSQSAANPRMSRDRSRNDRDILERLQRLKHDIMQQKELEAPAAKEQEPAAKARAAESSVSVDLTYTANGEKDSRPPLPRRGKKRHRRSPPPSPALLKEASWQGTSNHMELLAPDEVVKVIRGSQGDEIERLHGVLIEVGRSYDWGSSLRKLGIEAQGGGGSSLRDALSMVLDIFDRNQLRSRDEPRLVVKVLVVRELASTLIGFRGLNIQALRSSTGTNIHIDNGEPQQVVNITGQPANILKVCAQIHALMQDDNASINKPVYRHNGVSKVNMKLDDCNANGDKKSDDGLEHDDQKVLVHNGTCRPQSPPRPWRLEEHPDAPGEWYFLNEETGETT